MKEIKQSKEPKDFKTRFEFVLFADNNIICQRYFQINNFNPIALGSYELTEAVRECVNLLNKDLKEKSQTYLEIYAPKVFSSKEEMAAYITNPNNAKRLVAGEGLVVRGDEVDYCYNGDGTYKALDFKFDDGSLSGGEEIGKSTYKFVFKVDGNERCAMVWDGYYPKYVRDRIDLSNRRGALPEDTTPYQVSFEQYLLYNLFNGKSDLVWKMVRSLCTACSKGKSEYTTDTDGIINGWNESNNRSLWSVID